MANLFFACNGDADIVHYIVSDKNPDPQRFLKDQKVVGWVLADDNMNVLRKEGVQINIERLGDVYKVSYVLYYVAHTPVRVCRIFDRKGDGAAVFYRGT